MPVLFDCIFQSIYIPEYILVAAPALSQLTKCVKKNNPQLNFTENDTLLQVHFVSRVNL